jgi:dihydrofolate reductase
MLSMIVAHDRNHVIGKDNHMPWHYPKDLNYFKEKTLNKTIVMGSNTFKSIGRPLPKRHNVIITRHKERYANEHVEILTSVEDFLKAYGNREDEIFIIGGASIYQQLIDRVDRLYITFIDASYEGDTFFPAYDLNKFRLIEERQEDVLRFCVFEREVKS